MLCCENTREESTSKAVRGLNICLIYLIGMLNWIEKNSLKGTDTDEAGLFLFDILFFWCYLLNFKFQKQNLNM